MTVAAGQPRQNNIAGEGPAGEAVPIKPVPAGTPTPPQAPVGPPPNTDLLHYFKQTWGSRPSPEPPPAASPQPASPQPAAPAPATVSTLPPTGNRDLLHVIQNSIGGN
jgi:hypothetical protein